MKKFSQFVKENAGGQDQNHFCWAEGDIEPILEGLDEWSPENPKIEGKKAHFRPGNEPKPGSAAHQEFIEHDNNLSHSHKEHISYYKGDSYSTNKYLRKKVHPTHDLAALHDHIKNLEHVTSHKTQHDHFVFRGGHRGDISKFPAGQKFIDHGFTGTGFHPDVAAGFSYDRDVYAHSGKPIVHAIHVPKGTKAHYLDVNTSHEGLHPGLGGTEHELLLHRGSVFKVTHHSEDRDHHYIHSRVVAQHPRKLDLPKPVPGKAYSFSGYHHGEPQSASADKKKAKIAASIAKSKEKV